MKAFLYEQTKPKHLLFSLLMLCILSSCKKDQKKPVDPGIPINPAMQMNISGLYKGGKYVWERSDNNGYFIDQVDSVRVNVEFISAGQIKLQLLSSSPVPAVKSYNLHCIDTTRRTRGISYYKFQKLNSTSTQFSNFLVEILRISVTS